MQSQPDVSGNRVRIQQRSIADYFPGPHFNSNTICTPSFITAQPPATNSLASSKRDHLREWKLAQFNGEGTSSLASSMVLSIQFPIQVT